MMDHVHPGEEVIRDLEKTANDKQLAQVIEGFNVQILLIQTELGMEGMSVAGILKKLANQTKELKNLQLEESLDKRRIHDLMLDNEVLAEALHTEFEKMKNSSQEQISDLQRQAKDLQQKESAIDELLRIIEERETAIDILVKRMLGSAFAK